MRGASPGPAAPSAPMMNTTVPIRRVGSTLGPLSIRTPRASAPTRRIASLPRTRSASAQPASRTAGASPASRAPAPSRSAGSSTTATRRRPARIAERIARRRGRERAGRQHRAEPRTRDHRAPAPGRQHRRLRRVVARATGALRERQAEPSERGGLAPQGLVERRLQDGDRRTRVIGWRSASTPRTASRTASCSGPRVRSIVDSSPASAR